MSETKDTENKLNYNKNYLSHINKSMVFTVSKAFNFILFVVVYLVHVTNNVNRNHYVGKEIPEIVTPLL